MGREFRAALGLTLQSWPFYWKKTLLWASLASPRLTLTPVPLPTGQNLQGDTFGLENVYRHFQPSLQNVDPSTEVTQELPPPQLGAAPLSPTPWGCLGRAGHPRPRGQVAPRGRSHHYWPLSGTSSLPPPSSTFRGPRW